MISLYDRLSEVFHTLLKEYPGAKDYRDYVESRLSKEAIDTFKIGYFPGEDEINVLLCHFSSDELLSTGLVYRYQIDSTSYTTFFNHNRIIVPFRSMYGNVLAFSGRTILSDAEMKELGVQKYLHEKVFKRSHHLYNLDLAKEEIRKQDKAYVVEGQFDAISCFYAGIKNVVALTGSDMSQLQFSLLMRLTTNIELVLDNDAAGEKGRRSIHSKYGEYAKIIDGYVPSGYKDIDHLLKNNGNHFILERDAR